MFNPESGLTKALQICWGKKTKERNRRAGLTGLSTPTLTESSPCAFHHVHVVVELFAPLRCE